MHPSAYISGQRFFETYWDGSFEKILDIGAMDVNGSLRTVAPAGSAYLGIDLYPGPGVDQVLDDPYSYPFPDGSFDAVVSTSCLEHDTFFWLTFLEAARVVSDRGFLFFNVPSQATYHCTPDCWRFFPDAGLALEKWAERSKMPIWLVESCMLLLVENAGHIVRNPLADCVMVFSKRPDFAPPLYLCDQMLGAGWVRKGTKARLETRGFSF
jgi:SAM-dependent methyltransferase